VEALRDHLRENLAGFYASNCSRAPTGPGPVKRQRIPKSDAWERRARHPNGARPIHPAGAVTGPAAAIRSRSFLIPQPRLPGRGRRAHECRVRGAKYIQEVADGWLTWISRNSSTRVNHEVLIGRLAKRIADTAVLGLTPPLPRAGIMANGVVVERHEGTRRAAPCRRLLGNRDCSTKSTRRWRSADTRSSGTPMTLTST